MDEELFRQLLFAEVDGNNNIEEFIKLGYLVRSNDTIFRTNKLDEELKEFIDSKKESLYKAIEELGCAEDIKKVMELAGIKEFVTFSAVADKLVQDGRLIKDREKICIIR